MLWMLEHRPVHQHYFKRAFRKLSVYVLRILEPDALALVEFGSDSKFYFPATDSYWGRLLYRDAHPYEPEIETVLRTFSRIPFVFFDLGANYGYWSTRVTSDEFGAHKTIAVEASHANAHFLNLNRTENNERFEIVCKAISDSNGQKVTISGSKHAGKSIVDATGINKETVTTITIDDLVASCSLPKNSPIIVKLDVEGAEIAAIDGASKTLAARSLWIYEDHGKDREHRVTRRLLERGSVFYLDGASFVRVTDLSDLDRIKKNEIVGYNFIYTESRFWLMRIKTHMKRSPSTNRDSFAT